MGREGHTNLDQSFTFNFDVTKYLMLKNWKIDSNFVVFSQYSNVTGTYVSYNESNSVIYYLANEPYI